MLKKLRAALSIILVTTLLFNISFSITNATDSATNKISEELKKYLSNVANEDIIPIMVWFEDIDLAEVNAKAEKALGYTQEDINKIESEIPAIDKTVFSLDNTAYTKAIRDYESSTQNDRTVLSKMQNDLILTKRQLISESYTQYNENKNSELNIDSAKVCYVSRFSPTVFLEVSKNEIKNLISNDNVTRISYFNNNKPCAQFDYALPAVYVPYTKDTLGLDGSGVNVGVYDAGKVGTHSELNSTNITRIDPINANIDDHATFVTRIIAGSEGIVPEANIYSTSTDWIYAALENLIAEGVSVINMSLAFGSAAGRASYYTDMEQWVDHIAYEHNVTLVMSAGNDGVSTTILEPGLSYNIITVGGSDPQNTTSLGDDTLYTGSCSGNGGTSGCAKPDFLAPARLNDVYGTSISAPIVTGIIAQMIDYRPTIATNPALIKAILSASTYKKVLPGTAGQTEAWETTITAQQGAGLVSAQRALYILTNNRYATGTMSSGTISIPIQVTANDSYIRCAVSWIRCNSALSDHTTVTSLVAPAPNLRLHAYNPSGTIVDSSNITTSSVELVHFSTTTSGSHTAKITRMDTDTSSFRYAVVWY